MSATRAFLLEASVNKGLLLLLLACASGCAALLSAPVPMAQLRYPADPNQRARCLMVLLPGRGDSAADFEGHGIIAAARQRGLSIDLVAADATIGYYAKRTLLDRLQADVLTPALLHDYAQVWLVGTSMGGLGALLEARKQPGIQGILLLAPFLGDEDVTGEVAAAGGLATWVPPRIDQGDYQRELWRWLQAVSQGGEKAPEIVLGYGEADRFAPAHRLLAAGLPADHVLRAVGGHDWATWLGLFRRFVDGPAMRSACAQGPGASPLPALP